MFAKIEALRRACRRADGSKAIRTALVTGAKRAPAQARVVHALRAWGAGFDEVHFVGDGDKAGVLAAFGAHVSFDDPERRVTAASSLVAAAHVPNLAVGARNGPEAALDGRAKRGAGSSAAVR